MTHKHLVTGLETINRLSAELATVKAERDAMREALTDILALPIEHDNDTLQSIRRIAMIVKIARAALAKVKP